MAIYNNLVPLHVDKETGRIVASHRSGIPLAGSSEGYVFEQLVASDTWLIEHNLNSGFFIHQVFDIDMNLIIPDNFRLVDLNTVELKFGAPQDGYAHIVFFTVA